MKRNAFTRGAAFRSIVGLILGVGTLAAPIFVLAGGSASAGAATPVSGQIEICKTLVIPAGFTTNMSLTPTFTFTVAGATTTTVKVAAGSCSGQMTVTGNGSGQVVITEASAPWYFLSNVTQPAGQTGLVAPTAATLAAGTATVNLTAGLTETATFQNTVNTGYIEVCKSAATGSGLTGTFSFNIAGEDGFTTTASSVAGYCSNPVEVPAGDATITEAGTNLYVTGVIAHQTNTLSSVSALIGAPDLITGTATVSVAPSANASVQTDVTYTDNVVNLKICKVLDSTTVPAPTPNPITASTLYTFSVVPAGPSAVGNGPVPAPYSVSETAGTAAAPVCSMPVAYLPGTVVTITEGVVPGTKVESIATDGIGESVVPGSLNVVGRTIQIIIGTSVSSVTGPTNEAIVTYTNEYAEPGTLKICKMAGTPAPTAATYTFTVSGVTGTTSVPLGGCSMVGGTANPVQFPFNSTVTVSETGLTAPNMASAITVVPSFISEYVGGYASADDMLTAEANPVSMTTLPSMTPSVSVLIGELETTEVHFTDIDPPASVSASASAPASAGSSAPSVSNTAVTNSSVSNVVHPKTLTKAERAAALKKDERSLATVNAAIAKWTRTVKHTTGRAKKAAEKRLAVLRSERRVLLKDIAHLK